MSIGSVRLRRVIIDIREKSVMHEGGYLLYSPADELGEAFIIT